MATSLASDLKIEKLDAALGARVTGIDLSQPLDGLTKQALIDAWHEHMVLLYPGQDLTMDEQLAFAANFGELGVRSRSEERRPEGADFNPSIMMVGNIKDEEGNYAASLPDGEMFFHHDMCYMPKPHKGTYLHALQLPSTGGNTRFSNMYRAYDLLPAHLKQSLAGKRAIQVYDYDQTRTVDVDGDLTGIHHRWQPIFIRHPETGRTALYVNRLMTARIEGMEKEESDDTLAAIYEISEAPDNIMEHVWTRGDLIMWDNYCSCHARTDFPASETRLLRRCTTMGTELIMADAA
jgi:taurine dioxygenase